MNRICKRCGKTFEVDYPWRTQVFCSCSCAQYYKWENTPRGTVKFVCENCGKEFELPESDYRVKIGAKIKYCSRECAATAKRTGQVKACPVCGKEFYTTRTVCCSRSCALSYRQEDKQYEKLLETGHWKPSPVFPNSYCVSDKGEVYSKRLRKNLTPTKGLRARYFHYNLCENKEPKVVYAHRLVALAFIPNTENKPCVDHINGDKLDNRAENLRWVTNRENANNPLTIERRKAKRNDNRRQDTLSF